MFGISVYSTPWATEATVGAVSGALYPSTSLLTILPFGPEPGTFSKGIPFWLAMFLAIGLTKILPPVCFAA